MGPPSQKLCRYRWDLHPVKVAFSEAIHAFPLPSPPSDPPCHHLHEANTNIQPLKS